MWRVFKSAGECEDLGDIELVPHPTDPKKGLLGPRRYEVLLEDLYETEEAAQEALGSRQKRRPRNQSWRFHELAVGQKVPLEPQHRTTAANAAKKFRQREKAAGREWDFRVLREGEGQYALIRLK